MFREESAWIRDALARLELPAGARVLNLGSSSEAARREGQPFVDTDVLEPLRQRGLPIVNADIKQEPGVDVVCDLTAPDFDPNAVAGGGFELVLFTNVLPAVGDVSRAAGAAVSLVARGGHMLVTATENFRRTRDPIDNGFRVSPDQLLALLREEGGRPLEVLDQASIRIVDPEHYRRGLVRTRSTVRVLGRFSPVPGVVDQLRLKVPALSWRQSCLVLRLG